MFERILSIGWIVSAAMMVGVLTGAACGGTEAPCPERPCASGEICDDGVCRPPTSCPGGCPQGQTCSNGQCVVENPQCSKIGDLCNPNGPVNDGFLCVPWSGDPNEARCAPICSNGESCGSGAACVLVSSLADASCQSDSDCSSEKTCSSGRCRYAACRPSECEGLLEGDATCQEKYGDDMQRFPDGAKCYPIQNGANYCLPAGAKKRGESCQTLDEALQSNDFSGTCGNGLSCEEGSCQKICTAKEDCSGDEECVGVDSSTIAEGVGQCADTCEPFTDGACDDGETCRPIGDGAGRCVPAGSKPAFAECQPGQGQCETGTTCIAFQSAQSTLGVDTIARCQPMCDLSAGERGDDGTLSGEAQQRRDETCPQPDPAPAAVRFVHAAGGGGAIDVYRAGKEEPMVTGLKPGEAAGADMSDFMELDAGKYDFSVLPEGAPKTDLPLVKWTATLSPGDSTVFALGAPGSGSSDDLSRVAVDAADPMAFGSGKVGLRAVHLLPDQTAVDIDAVPTGDMPGGSSAVAIARDLASGATGDFAELTSGDFDIYVYPEGADRSDGSNAVLTLEKAQVSETSTLFLGGTLDAADEFATIPPTLMKAATAPDYEPEQPPMTCVESDDGVIGYCQQICTGGPADYGTGACDGDKMGCQPVLRSDRQEYEHLCGPVGDGAVGETCNPFASVGECKEGNYCLEYGNTRQGFQQGGDRGVCHSHCAVDGDGTDALGCPSGESCKPMSYQGGFDLGQCNVACEPGDNFTDMSCPAGLRSCKPQASLQLDETGQGNDPPVVRREQAFCSASGDVSPGSLCQARDCQPTSECMFPRSQQQSLLRTLLSPYFGASGLTPSCQMRCDPFDGDDSVHTCGSGETCLFNYPWSAEVGHCSEIAADLEPGASCDKPGLACGEDSICVDEGGESVCMRFCDYLGSNGQGDLKQSTCPTGYVCEAFVADVGVCRR